VIKNVCLALAASTALSAGTVPLAVAGDDNDRSSVNVSFGRGLNTAQPGNAVNHAILPSQIKVKEGGVVDFGVAGLHDIIVFKPGVTLDDLLDAGGGVYPTFPPVYVFQPDPTQPINAPSLADKVYYRGLNPAGGPAQTPVQPNPSNTMNRSEPVAFLEAGTYLVICNVRPHLLDGMYAYVNVSH
jgi:plastocyanin